MSYYFSTTTEDRDGYAQITDFYNLKLPDVPNSETGLVGGVVASHQTPEHWEKELPKLGFELVAKWHNRLSLQANLLYLWIKRPSNPLDWEESEDGLQVILKK